MGKWDKLVERIPRGTHDASIPFDELCRLMTRYEIILFWSAEDKTFVAEVPELPGCVAHGATQEKALAHAKEAIQLWLDTAEEFGDPIPEPKGRRLVFA